MTDNPSNLGKYVTAGIQFGFGGPEGIVGRVIDGMIAGAAVAWALEWWWAPRPSPRRSLVLVAGANAAITVSCV